MQTRIKIIKDYTVRGTNMLFFLNHEQYTDITNLALRLLGLKCDFQSWHPH